MLNFEGSPKGDIGGVSKGSQRDDLELHRVLNRDPLDFRHACFPCYYGDLSDRDHDVVERVQKVLFGLSLRVVVQEIRKLFNRDCSPYSAVEVFSRGPCLQAEDFFSDSSGQTIDKAQE